MSAFANETRDFVDAVALIKSLIESRQFRKEKLKEQPTINAIDILAASIVDSSDKARRLEAVSVLGKAGEISKPIASVVHPILVERLRSPLPSVGTWGNADDRYYLAKGLSVSDAPWITQYAAEELALAEVSEKASRAVWADLAVTRAESLAEALQTIAEALSAQTENPHVSTDTTYRKLSRIADALGQTFLTADVRTGNGLGKAFASLVILAGGAKGSESAKLREDCALTILDLLIQTLRLRFDAIFDSDLYRAVGSIRGWWRPGRPPHEVEQKVDRIADLAFSGLHVLARQGVVDKELRQALVAALGQPRTNAAGQKISSQDSSLDPALSHWLATGHDLVELQSNDVLRELNDQAADELLARLLVAVDGEESGPQALRLISEALELFEPSQASTLRAAAARLELVGQWAKALASKRRLSTYGGRGEIVQYDPALHVSMETLQRRSTVRISVPGVTREVAKRSPVIVMKAIVEKK
jgi:hypothetical protein